MDRTQITADTLARLGISSDPTAPQNDAELMAILQRSIFGEVFYTGELDDRTRELITVTVLATNQTLPQLKSHVGVCLNIGLSPVEIREAIYACATFIGYPRTLNAVGAMNDVFEARGIQLPLPAQGTVDEDTRMERGASVQLPLYGGEIRELLAPLPDGLGDAAADFLTGAFGDYYTRTGLDIQTRELLVLCTFVALGDMPNQIKAHSLGNFKLGNSKAKVVAAIIHCWPYTGFPRALNALRIVKDLDEPGA